MLWGICRNAGYWFYFFSLVFFFVLVEKKSQLAFRLKSSEKKMQTCKEPDEHRNKAVCRQEARLIMWQRWMENLSTLLIVWWIVPSYLHLYHTQMPPHTFRSCYSSPCWHWSSGCSDLTCIKAEFKEECREFVCLAKFQRISKETIGRKFVCFNWPKRIHIHAVSFCKVADLIVLFKFLKF